MEGPNRAQIIIKLVAKGLYRLVVTRVLVASHNLGSTPCGSEYFYDLMVFVLLVVDDDSETPMVSSSISSICRPNLR